MSTLSAAPIARVRSRPFSNAIGYYAAFIALGLFAASMGPTLPGLARHTGSRLSEISFLLSARSLGYLLGSLLSGRLYDRAPGHQVITGVLILMAVMMVLVPLIPLLWLLVAVLLVLGAAEGALDVGGNTLLVWLYRDKVGPFMNALHFFFGVGAFISPIVVAQAVQASGDITLAYWVLALLMLPALLWLIRLPSPERQAAAETRRSGQANRVLLTLLVLSFFVYVGAELSFGNWLYTYALTLGLADATTAAYLTSGFWGAFTAGRLISIPIATRFSPGAVLLADLVGCLAGVGVILLWPASPLALWIGACGAGFAMASIFPTMIAFAERRMTITGQITSLFLAGSAAGSMTLPWLIGQLFERVGPHVMTTVIAAALIVECIPWTGQGGLYGLIRLHSARRNDETVA
jgi:FHS family Na+ dependent glucose MFS transporter 1